MGGPALRDGRARPTRVVFTGDVMRPAEASFRAGQSENIRWFHRLLRHPVASATGLPDGCVTWGAGFDTDAAYGLWGVERSWRGWARIVEAEAAPAGVIALFEAAYGGALVVGFELSGFAKRVLSHLGIPLLDFSMHPVRFLDDVFFAVQANDPAVFGAMLPDHAEAGGFHAAAGLLAASALKTFPTLRIEAPTLLVGQTRVDRALVRDGRVLDFSDFAPEVRALLAEEGRLFFKPHPYGDGDFGLLSAGVPHAALRVTRANIYALMAHEALRTVVGLSSSVLAEARYFGCEARWLLGPPFDIPDTRAEAVPGQHLSVVEGAFDADRWRAWLAPIMPVTAADGRRWRPGANALRTSLRNFWGYNELTTDVVAALSAR